MDTSFSRVHLVGGLLSVCAIAHPLTSLTQFSPEITPVPRSRGAEFFARAQRNSVTISILARAMKPKPTPKSQKDVPDSPRRGVPGGGT